MHECRDRGRPPPWSWTSLSTSAESVPVRKLLCNGLQVGARAARIHTHTIPNSGSALAILSRASALHAVLPPSTLCVSLVGSAPRCGRLPEFYYGPMTLSAPPPCMGLRSKNFRLAPAPSISSLATPVQCVRRRSSSTCRWLPAGPWNGTPHAPSTQFCGGARAQGQYCSMYATPCDTCRARTYRPRQGLLHKPSCPPQLTVQAMLRCSLDPPLPRTVLRTQRPTAPDPSCGKEPEGRPHQSLNLGSLSSQFHTVPVLYTTTHGIKYSGGPGVPYFMTYTVVSRTRISVYLRSQPFDFP